LPSLEDADGKPIDLAPEIVAVLGNSNPPKFRRPSPVALSPEGRKVAFMPSNYQVTLWDVASAQPRHTLDVAPVWGHANSLAFDPDGRVISTATRTPGIQRWDTETGQLLESISLSDMEPFAQIGISIEGFRLAMQFEQLKAPVVVWDLVERRELWRMLLDETKSIALSPDGRLLATGGRQDLAGIAELWDLNTGEKIHEWRSPHAIGGLEFTRDGKRLFLIAGPTLVERDVATGQVSQELTAGSNWIYRMAVTSDGRVAATFHVKDCALRVWDIQQGILQKTILMPTIDNDYEAFGGWEFNSDGRHLLAARYDGLVFVLRID
jgi:WD40 repeat protein